MQTTRILPILQKELNTFFNSCIAYVTIGTFLLLMGLVCWVFPTTNILDQGYATMDTFFQLSPYLCMWVIPALTMRSLAEERKVGTLALLLTTSLTPSQLIIGKFGASCSLLILTLLLTSVYYISLHTLAYPPGTIDTAAIIGAYIGLLLLGAAFVAIGIFTSSCTDNQIVALLCSTLLCFLLYQGIDAWMTLASWKTYALYIAQLGILYHYEALSSGVIAIQDVLYFITIILLFLFFTKQVLQHKR